MKIIYYLDRIFFNFFIIFSKEDVPAFSKEDVPAFSKEDVQLKDDYLFQKNNIYN